MHKISTEHAQILLHTKYQQNTLRYYYTQNINRTRSDIITHKISTEHAQILLHTKYKYSHGQANIQTKACRQRVCKIVDNQK
jgi:CRISPR-associated protein Cas8b1/Cst1 subtype I-B